MHRVSYALSVALCCVVLATAAQAYPLVTYTWETLSSQYDAGRFPAPPLHLSFTIDGPVDVSADSDFAGPDRTSTVQYQFPSEMVRFNLDVGDLSIALSDFTSTCGPGDPTCYNPGAPRWTFNLHADPAILTGSLGIMFLDKFDNNAIQGDGTTTMGETDGSGFFTLSSDFLNGPATYTGQLIVTGITVPEPSSLFVLLAGLGMLALLRHHAGRFHR